MNSVASDFLSIAVAKARRLQRNKSLCAALHSDPSEGSRNSKSQVLCVCVLCSLVAFLMHRGSNGLAGPTSGAH